MTFNYESFKASFAARIQQLESAEKITRDLLREMSREVLYALHSHENIQVINELLNAKLTPVNRRGLVEFFKTFTGFFCTQLSDGKIVFTKKDKKNYDTIQQDVLRLLEEDPHFNFWSWSEPHLKIESKEFSLDAVRKMVENTVKKADKAGISFADVLATMLSNEKLKEALPAVLEKLSAKE